MKPYIQSCIHQKQVVTIPMALNEKVRATCLLILLKFFIDSGNWVLKMKIKIDKYINAASRTIPNVFFHKKCNKNIYKRHFIYRYW